MLVSTTVVSTRILRPLHDLLLLGNGDHSFVEVLDHLWPQGQRPLVHDGVIGNFAATHPRKGTVDQVGTDFALATTS